MMRMRVMAGAVAIGVALTMGAGASSARPARQDQPQKSPYTIEEYNAYKAADGEANLQNKIKLLDDFLKKYPESALLPYIYRAYYLTSYALKNYAATIAYTDKMINLGDKIDAPGRLEALVARAQAFYFLSAADPTIMKNSDALTKARDASNAGLKALGEVKKPDAVAQDTFDSQVKNYKILFNSIAAMASAALKDYPAAIDSYKAVLALEPNDAVTYYRIGTIYLAMNPPQIMDGLWELARSIAIKAPNGPNETQVKAFIRNQIVRYEQAACDNLTDDQVNELLTLAATSADRPSTWSIPSAADLDKARNDVASFLPTLKSGGDPAKVMWLATCGLEYPDVGVRVMADPTADGENLDFMVYRPAATDPAAMQADMTAATEPNMKVIVTGQPEAKRVLKDDQVRFTGTLTGYTQNPFLLTWEKAKINAEDIPPEKGAPAKKRPGKKGATH